MSLRPTLSGLSTSLGNFVTFVGDALERARYRRARLRQLPTGSVGLSGSSPDEIPQWMSGTRIGIRARDALVCPANSQVSYDIVLPANAGIAAWCGVLGAHGRDGEQIEFEMRVSTPRVNRSAARVVASNSARRWHLLRIERLEPGPARLVLTTSCRGVARSDLRILWGDPSIRVRRSGSDLVTALQSTLRLRGARGFWYSLQGSDNAERLYALWVREHEPSAATLLEQRRRSEGSGQTLGLITFVDRSQGWKPDATIHSVLGQSYPNWEWIVVGPDDSLGHLQRTIAHLGPDPRIRTVAVAAGSHRALAWNVALDATRAPYAALLGANDTLSPSALYEMAAVLEGVESPDVLYSDEDRLVGESLLRVEPSFKPEWSPDYLCSRNYLGRLAMMRVSRVRAVGGFDPASVPSEEWQLWLRLSRSGARLQRLPMCLYHRQGDREETGEGHAILAERLATLGLRADVTTHEGASRIRWPIDGQPLVSIVIPNRNAAAILQTCLTGLLERTSYSRREVVIVDNGSTDPEVFALYDRLRDEGKGRVVPFDRPFNFSAACNLGAAAADGELLLFLNNDVEVVDPDWLDELVRWAQLPQIGIVGAKLLYPDRSIQHAGVVFGVGLVGHIFNGASEGGTGVFGSVETYRNYLAVTGACQMMRKDVFRRLGGYDERFRLVFSDVVLCMEAWRKGLRVVYTPYARLIHHESYTRKKEDSAEDMRLLAEYLKNRGFMEDPYFHPELDPTSAIPRVRPPFDPTPRQVIGGYVDRVLAAAPR